MPWRDSPASGAAVVAPGRFASHGYSTSPERGPGRAPDAPGLRGRPACAARSTVPCAAPAKLLRGPTGVDDARQSAARTFSVPAESLLKVSPALWLKFSAAAFRPHGISAMSIWL